MKIKKLFVNCTLVTALAFTFLTNPTTNLQVDEGFSIQSKHHQLPPI